MPKLGPEQLAKMKAGRDAYYARLKEDANNEDPSTSVSERNAKLMASVGVHARQRVTLWKEKGSAKWNKLYQDKVGHIAALNLSDAEVLVKAEGFASNGLWFRLSEIKT